MANTAISNVVVPQVYTDYFSEGSVLNDNLFRSGIFNVNSELVGLLNGGATSFKTPFWKDDSIVGTDFTPVNEGGTLTPSNITTGSFNVRRQFFEAAWGTNSVASVLAGEDAAAKIASLVDKAYASNYQKWMFSTLKGVIADNIANDSSDTTYVPNAVFSYDGAVTAQLLLGDASDGFTTIAVHSKVWGDMVKDDAIEYQKLSEQEPNVPFYQGMRVIRNDLLVDGTDYINIIMKPSAFAFGESFANYKSVEIGSNHLASGGEEQLVVRRVFAMHPFGYDYSDGTITNTFPTRAEMEVATRWDRAVSDKKLLRMVAYKSK